EWMDDLVVALPCEVPQNRVAHDPRVVGAAAILGPKVPDLHAMCRRLADERLGQQGARKTALAGARFADEDDLRAGVMRGGGGGDRLRELSDLHVPHRERVSRGRG